MHKPELPKLPDGLKRERFQNRLLLKAKGLPSQSKHAPLPVRRSKGTDGYDTVGEKVTDDFTSTSQILKWVKRKIERELEKLDNGIKRRQSEIEYMTKDFDMLFNMLNGENPEGDESEPEL